MVLSVVWVVLAAASLITAAVTGNTGQLSGAALEGAASGVSVVISMAGGICLWSGLMNLLKACGVTDFLARLLSPLLRLLFPKASRDPVSAGHISANLSANLLGLGNAATPAGIAAVEQMKSAEHSSRATHEMCRLIVLNTASIQLLPTTVAAVRAGLGASAPFDILPAVWITSLLSSATGVAAAILMGKLCHD